MRKAVTLTLRVTIKGEDAPAHDFAASSLEALKDIIAKGAASHPELQVIVAGLKETPNDDEDSDMVR